MIGLSTIDGYTVRARILPAIIAAAPGFALTLVLISWDQFTLSDIGITIGSFALLTVFADIARRRGKSVEENLFAKWGGKPSTTMLRHRDHTMDAGTKARYRAAIAKKINERAPSAEDEEKDPEICDAFYARCGTWLRENTRDAKKFTLLMEENMTYGFRRNLLGLKWIGIGLSGMVVILCSLSLGTGFPLAVGDQQTQKLVGVLILAGLQVSYLLIFVSEAAVLEASRQYARQLLLSCESLIPFTFPDCGDHFHKDGTSPRPPACP